MRGFPTGGTMRVGGMMLVVGTMVSVGTMVLMVITRKRPATATETATTTINSRTRSRTRTRGEMPHKTGPHKTRTRVSSLMKGSRGMRVLVAVDADAGLDRGFRWLAC